MPWSVKKMNNKFCVVKEGEESPIKGGCHASRSEATDHLRALYSSEAEMAVSKSYEEDEDMENKHECEDCKEGEECEECEDKKMLSGDTFVFADTMKEYAWEGPIVFENVATGDNRIFKSNSIVWQEDTLPWAFRWQKHSGQGHAGSVPVGRVDRIERKEDGSIYGFGVVIPELSEEAAEYLKMLQTGVGGGVSVDGDSAQFEIQEVEGGTPRVEFSAMRLRALSAVDIPAFNGARIRLSDQPIELAVSDEETEEVDIELNLEEKFNMDEKEKFEMDDMKDEEESEEEESEEEESEEEESKDVVDEDKDHSDNVAFMREELARKKKRKKMGYSYGGWQIDDSITAAAIPVLPSTEAFQTPSFEGPTPLTVTQDGKVFGHLALFNTCHIGFPGTCVKPPKGSNYQYFHTGEIETSEGDLVEVGHLTFKTGHAEMSANPRVAAEHYDNTGAVAADVRAGEDKWGIWVAGALRPTLSDQDIREFRAAPLSGDWRRIGGKLELVGALAVNVPGFPVPRVKAMVASGETETLFTFIEDDNEEFFSYNEIRKVELASKLEKFLGEKLDPNAPDEKIEEDPPIPSKSEVKSAAENMTKNELFKNLRLMKEFMDDPDSDITPKQRKTMEELYALFIKTDDKGRRTEASGYDLDIIENSGLEIEEWERQLEFSGLGVEEFYNTCHDENGRFCEGPDGPGRVRDKAPTARHFVPGRPHGKDDPEHRTSRPSSGPSSGPSSSPPSSPPSSGGDSSGGGSKAYENYRITRKRSLGWLATAAVAYGALASPTAGVIAPLIAPISPLLANPAVLSLLAATGVAKATQNYLKARQHRIRFNQQIDRSLKIRKAREAADRAIKRAEV